MSSIDCNLNRVSQPERISERAHWQVIGALSGCFFYRDDSYLVEQALVGKYFSDCLARDCDLVEQITPGEVRIDKQSDVILLWEQHMSERYSGFLFNLRALLARF